MQGFGAETLILIVVIWQTVWSSGKHSLGYTILKHEKGIYTISLELTNLTTCMVTVAYDHIENYRFKHYNSQK